MVHPKTIASEKIDSMTEVQWVKAKYKSAQIVYDEGKHKYLMPLDKKMRKLILPLAKPYPKKEE